MGLFIIFYNRGNHREPIFHGPADYERFLWMFSDAAAEYGVDVTAYCLMPNHYHALVRQGAGGSLERMMRSFTIGYSMFYNRRYGQVGHLFQGRYRVRLIRDEADLVNVSRYIHRNLVELASLLEYEWSSYRAYLGEPNRFCDPEPVIQAYRDAYGHGSSYDTFCASVERPDLPGGFSQAAATG